MESRGKRKSKVPLLCFLQVRASVLSDSKENGSHSAFRRSMAECLFPEIGEQDKLGENVIKKARSLSKTGLGSSDWGVGRETLFFKIVISSSLWTMAVNILTAFELLFSGLEFIKAKAPGIGK